MSKVSAMENVERIIDSELRSPYLTDPIQHTLSITYAGKTLTIRFARSTCHSGSDECYVILPFMTVCLAVCEFPGKAKKMYTDYKYEWHQPTMMHDVRHDTRMTYANGTLQFHTLSPLPSRSNATRKIREEFEAGVALFIAEVKPQIESFVSDEIELESFDRLIASHNDMYEAIDALFEKFEDLNRRIQNNELEVQRVIEASSNRTPLLERAKRLRNQ